MTQDEIIRMAREAGFSEWALRTPQDLERFAALVAEATKAQPQDHIRDVTKKVQGEWVDLTDDEVKDVIRFGVEGVTVSEMVMFRAVARKIEAKFKSKNAELLKGKTK